MNELKDDEIIEAIDSYNNYTKSLREILKSLIKVSINGVADVTASYLMDKLCYTRATVYNGIKRLQNDDIIIRVRKKNSRFDSYEINKKNLSHITILHNKKKSL